METNEIDLKSLDLDQENCDCFEVRSVTTSLNLPEVISVIFNYRPRWIQFLFVLRRLLASILRLKQERQKQSPALKPEDISFQRGASETKFTVLHGDRNRYWVSRAPADRHLEAKIAVVLHSVEGKKKTYKLITWVRYLHWTGKLYFNLIRPFHHIIVFFFLILVAWGVAKW
jgi:hypothetical protein